MVTVMGLSTILTGCSDTSDEGAAQGVEDKEITLSFMNHTGEDKTVKYENQLIEEFEEKHPNVKIEVQRMSMDDYNQSIQTKMASGDSPDIFAIEPTNLEKYVQNEYLMDLTDTAVADNYEAGSMLSYEGKLYAAPQAINVYVAHYNKEIFAAAGVEIPTTLEEFYNACERLQTAGYTPLASGYQEAWVVMADSQAEYIPGVLAKDPEAIGKLQDRSQTFTASPEWRGVFERLGKRLSYAQPDPFGTDWSSACTLLATGEAAMIVNGDWTANNLDGMGDGIELGAFLLPVSDNESENVLSYSTLNGGYSISATCEYQDIAIEFLQHFTSQEAGSEFVKQGIGISIVKDVAAPEGENTLVDITNIMNSEKNTSIGNNPINFDDEFRDAFQNIASEFLLDGGTDVDKALADLDSEFDRIAGR